MNSNLMLVPPFIILVMRHWTSSAAVDMAVRIPTHTILVLKEGKIKSAFPPAVIRKPACGDPW
eukprot:scaffold74264_cov109-Cyclotella_meneghiniana.AAC.1